MKTFGIYKVIVHCVILFACRLVGYFLYRLYKLLIDSSLFIRSFQARLFLVGDSR
jgi:hypothetical protein